MIDFKDLLQYINLLLVPILLYIIKVEIRLTKIETMQSAEFTFLMNKKQIAGRRAV